MRIEKELKRWIMFHVKAELEGDPSLKRDDLIHSRAWSVRPLWRC